MTSFHSLLAVFQMRCKGRKRSENYCFWNDSNEDEANGLIGLDFFGTVGVLLPVKPKVSFERCGGRLM